VRTLQDLPYEMLSQDAIGRLTQLFKRFDKNNDGKLDDDERTAMLTFARAFQERPQPEQ
jgi:Ca2+-binding EF-hand superfamily protein